MSRSHAIVRQGKLFMCLKDETGTEIASAGTRANQTTLVRSSMMVIAPLIGAKGLGQDVLVALQHVARGQRMLAGLAILVRAKVIDRIVQGYHRRMTMHHRSNFPCPNSRPVDVAHRQPFPAARTATPRLADQIL